jgi:hypothetical protein
MPQALVRHKGRLLIRQDVWNTYKHVLARHRRCCCCPCTQSEWYELAENGTPCHDLGTVYRIADYADNLFDPAGCGCWLDTSSPPWTGYYFLTGWQWRCLWEAWGWPDIETSINGRRFFHASLSVTWYECTLTVECQKDQSSGFEIIWQGRHLGRIPEAEAFIRDAGCSEGPSAVALEKVA